MPNRYPDNFPFSIDVRELDDVIDNGIKDIGCEVQFATFQGRGFEFHKVDVINFGLMPEEVYVWAPVDKITTVIALVEFINPHLSILVLERVDAGIKGYVKLVCNIKYR